MIKSHFLAYLCDPCVCGKALGADIICKREMY